jgi:hypothetical protein
MKLLEPIFSELQEKTTKLIASFSEKDLQIIEAYFMSAIQIMKETTETLNEK